MPGYSVTEYSMHMGCLAYCHPFFAIMSSRNKCNIQRGPHTPPLEEQLEHLVMDNDDDFGWL